MFPGAGATVYRNEAGEPTGWSYENYDEPPDPEEMEREWERTHCVDCGQQHAVCVCDRYCSSCGEHTLLDTGTTTEMCSNPECPSNQPVTKEVDDA